MIARLGFGAMARKVFRKRLVRQIGTALTVRLFLSCVGL